MQNFYPELLWVDLQMSGLDPIKNRILEFACVLSDKKLTHCEPGPHIIIHCDQQHLKTMDDWNTKHHSESGLYASCLTSKISLQQAQDSILSYLKAQNIMEGQLNIAGNSVHMDKLFLFHHMPKLNAFLHYRILDVTSVKMVVNAMNPQLFYKKKGKHRAMDDIAESINELKFYMSYAFGK